jgi:hypothetical protein
VAVLLLVRAGHALEPGVGREIPLGDPAAREALAALPAEAVRHAVLERFHALDPSNPSALQLFVSEVEPLFDAVGSSELARALLARLGGPDAKPLPGIAPSMMARLKQLAPDG